MTRTESGVAVAGYVRAYTTDEMGRVVEECRVRNLGTNWTRYAVASWYTGRNNTGQDALPPPAYVGVGTGQGTPAQADMAMYAELYDLRRALTFVSVYQAYTAQLTLSYQTTDPNITYYEAGLWDGPVATTSLSAAVSAGATSLPMSAGAPAVQGGTTPGQYNTAYIADASNPEYVSIAVSAAAGASSWTIQSGLQYSHASGTQVVAFVGNLWAHAAFSITKNAGQQLTVQWSIPIQTTTG